MYGGVEVGGTKVVCVVGTGPGAHLQMTRIPTTTPDATLSAAAEWLGTVTGDGPPLRAIGIGSFGPLELRRGHPHEGRITATPKPGWQGVDVRAAFRGLAEGPVALDTDVHAALLGESRWGAARGIQHALYVTIGTGIGGAAILGGVALHGAGHAEMGHVAVRRARGDTFDGSCPFHGDCLEGMASGPAIAARFGVPAERLAGETRELATALVAHYLASGVRSLVYALAPERVILGGGLAQLPGLVPLARAALMDELGGYAVDASAAAGLLVLAELGQMAGPLGALAIAEAAAEAQDREGR